MAQAVRLKVTEPAFLAFCAALANERAAAGAGPAARVGIGQRADALAVIAALNDSDGWLLPGEALGSVTAEAVFARNLAPILCETPAMQDALHRVLARDRLPGDFDPPLPYQTVPSPAPPPETVPDRHEVLWTLLANEIRWRWLRLRSFAGSRLGQVTLGVGGLAIAAALSAPWVQSGFAMLCASTDAAPRSGPAGWVCPAPVDVGGTVVDIPESPDPFGGKGGAVASSGGSPEPLSAEAQLGPLNRALTALERTGFDRSPAELAGHLAQTGTLGLDPALYLQAMLTRWPMASCFLPPKKPK